MDIQKIPTVLEKIKIMMNEESKDDQIQISSATNTLIRSEKFINSIKNDVEAIMSDGKIAVNDIPKIMMILMKSEELISSLSSSASKFKMSHELAQSVLKYSTYSLLYWLLISCNSTIEEIESFDCLFPGLWKLVELTLPSVKVVEQIIVQKVESKSCC